MPIPWSIPTPDPAALERWLAGESPPDEARDISAWVEAEASRRHTAAGLKALDAVGAQGDIDLDMLWARVHTKVRRGPTSMGLDPHRGAATSVRPVSRNLTMWLTRVRMSRSRMSRMPMAMSLVAVGVLVLGAAVWMTRSAFRHTTPSAARTYATAARQRATITLTDGSRVTLAPQTMLTVAGDFGRATRTVALRGEAYFEVASTSGAPFVVQSNDVRARVLGTAFSVRRYAGDRDTRIAVVTGKVAVNTVAGSRAAARRPAVVLSAGMVGIVTDSSAIAMSVRDLTPYTGWVNGQLVVRDAPVSQALAMLGDWYGFEFRLHDTTLAARHLTDTFDPDNPTEMLMALKAVLNVEMTFDGNVITVRPRRSAVPKVRTRDTEQPLLTPQLQREVGRE